MSTQNAFIRLIASLFIGLWMTTSVFAEVPWETITEKKGSYREHVVGIKINEDSKQPIDNDKLVHSFAKAVSKADKALIEKRARDLYWSTFAETFGIGGAISTFAENAMEVESLRNINILATKLGLFLGGYQVYMNIIDNDQRSAFVNSYKTMQGYAIGNYGWKSLQIASVGIFCIDYSLNKFGTEAWLEQTNKWRKAYLHYYKTHGRKMVEWEKEVRRIHADAVSKTTRLRGTTVKEREAMKVLYFENRVESMLTEYTEAFWNAKFLEEHLGMTGSAGGGLE